MSFSEHDNDDGCFCDWECVVGLAFGLIVINGSDFSYFVGVLCAGGGVGFNVLNRSFGAKRIYKWHLVYPMSCLKVMSHLS